jgi:DNA-binding MarR family transcriptional regulator
MQKISCTYYIRAIYHSLKHYGQLDNKSKPLNPSQQSILFLLSSRGEEMSLSEIKDELNLSQTGVAKLTTQLEQRGCIKKFIEKSDRRIKKVVLLEKGKTYCARAKKEISETEALLLEGLSEEDRDKLRRYLSILYHNSRKLDSHQS